MAASKWHRITNITDSDLAGSLTLLGGTVFRECNIKLAGTSEVFTLPFDWAIKGDFTVVVNSGSVNVANTYFGDSNCKIAVRGSVDGDTYIDLDTATDKDFDTKPYAHVYDYDGKGIMPYMRIGLDGSGNGAEVIKVAIFPH